MLIVPEMMDGMVLNGFNVYRVADNDKRTIYSTADSGSHDWVQGGASGYVLWSSDGEYVEYDVRANGNQSWNRTIKIIHINTSSIKYSMVNMTAGNNKKILFGEYAIEGNKLYKVSDINTLINTMQVSLPSTYELNRYYSISNFIFVDRISAIDVYRLEDNELELMETITTNNTQKNQGYSYGDGYTPNTQAYTYCCPGTGYFYTNTNGKIFGFLEGVHGQLIGLTKSGVTYYNGYDATATSNDMISSKVAYNSTGKIIGTIPNNGALSYTPTTSQQNIANGYHSGSTIAAVTSAIDANIASNNIKTGVTILGVAGALANCYTFSTVVEMEAFTPSEDTYAIVYGTTYIGTYRYDNNAWTQIGDSTEEQQIMDVLNQVTDTTDQYEGAGGTDVQINAVLDSILGNGGN